MRAADWFRVPGSPGAGDTVIGPQAPGRAKVVSGLVPDLRAASPGCRLSLLT